MSEFSLTLNGKLVKGVKGSSYHFLFIRISRILKSLVYSIPYLGKQIIHRHRYHT